LAVDLDRKILGPWDKSNHFTYQLGWAHERGE
jgi:hypothetical protein